MSDYQLLCQFLQCPTNIQSKLLTEHGLLYEHETYEPHKLNEYFKRAGGNRSALLDMLRSVGAARERE